MSIIDTITTDDFKSNFYRDFAYADNQSDYTKIIDNDINKAFREACSNFNENLFEDEEEQKMAFLYLAAFYLVLDIKNSSAGLNSSFVGFTTSKSVDNVSESFYIPDWIKKNPVYSIYMNNGYGQKYISLLYPRLIGGMYLVKGETTID